LQRLFQFLHPLFWAVQLHSSQPEHGWLPIRIQDRRNLIYGFSGRPQNTALTIKPGFFSQKDAGSKANHPLVRHRMLLAVEIASASKLSGSNRECNAFCRSGNLRKGRGLKRSVCILYYAIHVLCCAYDNGGPEFRQFLFRVPGLPGWRAPSLVAIDPDIEPFWNSIHTSRHNRQVQVVL
jgi:hypothetical protein